MSTKAATIAREVYYSGRVQGVGFRWNARHVARGYRVTGFVRNLDDGRVQLVAVGDREEVERFLQAVADSMQGNITNTVVSEHSPASEYPDFAIRS